MILGIIGAVGSIIMVGPLIIILVLLLLSIIFGTIALLKATKNPARYEGKGLAVTGIGASLAGVLVFVLIQTNVIGRSNSVGVSPPGQNNSSTQGYVNQFEKSGFTGTWKVAPESKADYKGGPITFDTQGRYTARQSDDPSSSEMTGTYSYTPAGVKSFDIFNGGLANNGLSSFLFSGDRLKVLKGGKTIYFVRG